MVLQSVTAAFCSPRMSSLWNSLVLVLFVVCPLGSKGWVYESTAARNLAVQVA